MAKEKKQSSGVQNRIQAWKKMSGRERFMLIFNNIEECIASIALTMLLLLTCVNVIGRYIFKYSVPGVEELVTLCFTWAVFLGASACYKRNMHYGIDLLVNALPESWRLWLMRFTHLFLTVVLGYVAYLSFELTANVGLKVTSYYMLSYRYVDAAAVLGFGFMCIHSLRFFIRDCLHPEQVMDPLIAETDYTDEGAEEISEDNDTMKEGGDAQ